MKKLLLGLITILIIILIAITVIKGIQIGEFKILGITEIKQEDEDLDKKINNATRAAGSDYQRKIDELNEAIKKLENEKETYQDMVNVSTESEVEASNQLYKNTIDFIFVRIENHAKSEGVNIDLSVTRSSSGAENTYNLNFTARGPYAGIEEFITDIEDDSKLGFKIEEFKMVASSESSNQVEASFTCKDITINGINTNIVNSQTNENDTTNTTNTNNTTSTNNTAATNTAE